MKLEKRMAKFFNEKEMLREFLDAQTSLVLQSSDLSLGAIS